ncbi:hypothetical protein NDU88_004915 [Pleurodeles waltl]|uniref:Uncharacterized protein n=1 Tax=Pleurodeles waltl TaxID=8319 RepID=A0AAV7LJR4_PLEWA|nr:hypothetical protein NDU88_004915 [Pleurodeles waltl]
MGKTDKNQSKLQFELRKMLKPREDVAVSPETDPNTLGPEMGSELHQVLTKMQIILTKTNGKIDALFNRTDRMTECIDKQSKGLDTVERRVSDVEVEQATSAGTHKQLEKTILELQAKVEELEGCSQRK